MWKAESNPQYQDGVAAVAPERVTRVDLEGGGEIVEAVLELERDAEQAGDWPVEPRKVVT